MLLRDLTCERREDGEWREPVNASGNPCCSCAQSSGQPVGLEIACGLAPMASLTVAIRSTSATSCVALFEVMNRTSFGLATADSACMSRVPMPSSNAAMSYPRLCKKQEK